MPNTADNEKFLYQKIEEEFGRRGLNGIEIPSCITDNLRPEFVLRPYQLEALRRFIAFYENEEFAGSCQRHPWHLVFNMATGSGKTLIMAAQMLYLYKQGYRHFLFFVNSTTVIKKTIENFMNQQSGKYLFAERVVIDGVNVPVRMVNNFDEASDDAINIMFSTIQGIDSGMFKNIKENGLNLDDLKELRLVLIADEAHHNDGEVWGEEIEKILVQNDDNLLLAFTASLQLNTPEMIHQYANKILYRYDLKEFRGDLYTKEINIFRSESDVEQRMLQSMVLNIYRQEIANAHGINLKPVVLYKSRIIKESNENEQLFHDLVKNLTDEKLQELKEHSSMPMIVLAFKWFEQHNISLDEIAYRLRNYFMPENCLNANNDAEVEKNQIILNSLEEQINPVRAIFAVDKLNEGWDVLNLFDIVRLYDTRDAKNGVPGKTTNREAQLIGRGARYFPFSLTADDEKYKRKFDYQPDNELRILEELYYHIGGDSRYVSEIKTALRETGMADDEELVECSLKMKESFRKSDFYQNGYVFYNTKVKVDRSGINSFADLQISQTGISYTLSGDDWSVSGVFSEEEKKRETETTKVVQVLVKEIPLHIVRYELARCKSLQFNILLHFFPNLNSMREFCTSDDYLGGVTIQFEGPESKITHLTPLVYQKALRKLLGNIAAELECKKDRYTGTEFVCRSRISDIFPSEKILHINKSETERIEGQKEFLLDKDWFAYNANYGTDEEREFVKAFDGHFVAFNDKYEDIYLLRNELFVHIYDDEGRRFDPDYILFCRQNKDEYITYQVFIEPKGTHLLEKDKWKQDFLQKIAEKHHIEQLNTDKYMITAVPIFSNKNKKRDFDNELQKLVQKLEEQSKHTSPSNEIDISKVISDPMAHNINVTIINGTQNNYPNASTVINNLNDE